MPVTGQILVDQATYRAADKILEQIDIAVRGKAVTAGLREIGNKINAQTRAALPNPGYTRYTRPKNLPYHDKPNLTPLKKTPKVKTIDYHGGAVKVAISGYEWPEGAHGHLVELGHDLVKGGKKGQGGVVIGHVEPAEYMVEIVNTTVSQQQSDFLNGLRKLLRPK